MNKLNFYKTGLSLFGLLFFLTVRATIINVPTEHSTIQQAIDASLNGDTVLVDIGTYNENVRFNGKNITLTSKYIESYDTSYIEQTIIDGSNGNGRDTGSCVAFLHDEDTTAILQGFTLMNGKGTKVVNNGNTLYEGGGIIIFNASPTIKNNIIKNNTTISGGGGIASFVSSTPRIYNNIIANNISSYAGGIVLNWCGGYVKNNIIFNNLATGFYGTGGLMVWGNEANVAYVENNTIIGNSAYTTAGGLSTNRTGLSIVKNNLIKNNTQGSGDEIVINTTTTYENNNSSLNEGSDGNIDVLPEFRDKQFRFSNPEAGNYVGAHRGALATSFPDFSFESIKTNQALTFTMQQGEAKTNKLFITNNSSQTAVIDSIVYPTEVTGLQIIDEFSGMSINPLITDSVSFTIQPDAAVNIFDSVLIYHQFTSITNPIAVTFILDSDKALKEDISDLQAYYTFNDITDNIITDELGVTNGTCTNSTVSVYGADGKCLGFNADGGTGIISIPNTDSINFGVGESFSISMLYKGDPLTYTSEVFILMKGSTSGNWYAISTKNGQIRFTIDDDIVKTTMNYSLPENFDARLWHHIVAVRDCESDLLKLYIDGNIASSMLDNTEETIESSNNMEITNYNPALNSGVDDLRIYGKAISNYEVADLFNTYTVPELSSESELANLSVTDYDFEEGAFTNETVDYSCVLAGGATKANIEATAVNYWASIEGAGSYSDLPGTAIIKVTSEDGENSTEYSIAFTLDATSVEPALNEISKLTVYPNPATEYAIVKFSKDYIAEQAVIYDNLGQPISSFIITDTEYFLNTQDYPKGVYFIKTQNVFSRLVIK